MLPKVYFDEAGNTGSNITNLQQPYFVLSSVCFTDEELEQIKKDVPFSDELHFMNIKSRWDGRKAIKSLLNYPLLDEEHVTYQVVDKTYALYAFMVDSLIEPFVKFQLNEDLYKGKGNILLANCLYIYAESEIEKGGPTADFVDDLKVNFERMMRIQTEECISEFYETLNILISVTNGGFQEILYMMLPSEHMLNMILTEDKKYCLDVTVSSLLVLTNHWHKKFGTKIDVFSDNSKPLSEKRVLIEQLMNITGYQSVGYDNRKMTYPLQINSLNFVDSKDCYGAQIADIVASAVAFSFTGTKDLEKFQEEIKSSALLKYKCYPLMPSSAETLLQPVDSSNDSDPLDFIVEKLANNNS